MSSLIDDGRELIADGRVGNELAVYDEYPAHPKAGEGPWHLLPKGPVRRLVRRRRRRRCRRTAVPLGERIVVTRPDRRLLRYTQTLTLWHGVDRVDCQHHDRRVHRRGPAAAAALAVPGAGALPVSEVGDAVIGRGFGLLHDPDPTKAVDTAKHPWTLDNPAYGWFGLSSAVRVARSADGVPARCRWPRWSSPTEAEPARWPAT